jgi:DUF4097 and DUF4098 domain-containing protein YvlB
MHNLISKFLIITLFILMLVNFNTAVADDIILREETLSTSAGKELKVKTFSGDVKVSTWSSSEVYVKIIGNEEAKENLDFKIENSDDGVDISIKKNSTDDFSNLNLSIEIKTPQIYNADISTASGDLELNGLSGNIKMKTASGDIKTSETTGSADLKTAGGDIKSSDYTGDISVSTAGGDITLDGSNGNVSGATAGGNIKLIYSGTNSGIKLTTSGGDIEISLPGDFAANCKLTTISGEIMSDIPITSESKVSETKLKGTMNGGGEQLKCSTSSGDIKIFSN